MRGVDAFAVVVAVAVGVAAAACVLLLLLMWAPESSVPPPAHRHTLASSCVDRPDTRDTKTLSIWGRLLRLLMACLLCLCSFVWGIGVYLSLSKYTSIVRYFGL